MRELQNDLKIKKELINTALHDYLPITFPEELHAAARHLIDAGGKRLRPAVLLLAAEAVKPDIDLTNIVPAAVAIELVHNFTLIHDDIMDDDTTRHGIETVHVKWGISEGLIAGDTLYAKAFEALTYTKTDPEKIVKCLRLLSKTCAVICSGQWLDISFENNKRITEQEYIEMVEQKTAVIYAAAAAMGGILADANNEEINALWDLGIAMGIGFQIRDDVLDIITPFEILGKDRASDLVEGKMTLIMIHALHHGVKLNIKPTISEQDTREAIQLLQNSGSIGYATMRGKELVKSGKSKLSVLKDTTAKQELLELADYMIEREY
jgi:geranylgeranyl diphosphate synthase type I